MMECTVVPHLPRKGAADPGDRLQSLGPRSGELGRGESLERTWAIGVDELESPKADVAAGGHTESESNIGARSHCFLHNKESA